MAAIEFAGQLRCLSDLGQLPARRKEKKNLAGPRLFLNGGCYIDRTLDGFFFQPHFLIYTVLFLIILNIIGRKKKSEGEKEKKAGRTSDMFRFVLGTTNGRQCCCWPASPHS